MIKIHRYVRLAPTDLPRPVVTDDRYKIPSMILSALWQWLVFRREPDAAIAIQETGAWGEFRAIARFSRVEFRVRTAGADYYYRAVRGVNVQFEFLAWLLRIEKGGKVVFTQKPGLNYGGPLDQYSDADMKQAGLEPLRKPPVRAALRDLFPEEHSGRDWEDAPEQDPEYGESLALEDQVRGMMFTPLEVERLRTAMSKEDILRDDTLRGFRIATVERKVKAQQFDEQLDALEERTDSLVSSETTGPYGTTVWRADGAIIPDLCRNYNSKEEALEGHYELYRQLRTELDEEHNQAIAREATGRSEGCP